MWCPRTELGDWWILKYFCFVPATDDVGEFTAELVEKMEHFKVAQEKVSALKTMAIKLEVGNKTIDCKSFNCWWFQALYSAWSSGALTLSYLQLFLESAKKKVSEAESELAPPPWAAVWDRLVPFTFTSSTSSFSDPVMPSLIHRGPAIMPSFIWNLEF